MVDSRGLPITIDEKANDSNDPTLFPTSSMTLKDLLGGIMTEPFLFLSIEWVDKMLVKNIDNNAISERIFHESLNDVSKGLTLDQCLLNFTKPERLDEGNKYFCSKCKQHVRAMKTMRICQLPSILIVHLKRFEYKHTFRRNKLDAFVDCPINGLDMSKLLQLESESTDIIFDKIPAVYDLFGVTNHYGRMGFGHYTAFCRQWDTDEGMSKEWTLFDDSRANQKVEEEDVITSAAYVLFYRRRQVS